MNENGAVSADELTHREAAEAAAKAASSSMTPRTDEVTLSNGVVVKVRPVSGLLVRRAMMQVTKPPVPMWDNPDRGRPEPNPNDPDYLDALERYETATQDAALNLMLILGTEVTHVPPTVVPLDSDEWLEQMEFCGVAVSKSGPGRYRDWLSYIVLANAQDMVAVEAAVTTASGLSEGDIAKAMDSFRGTEVRGADPERDTEDDQHRDLVPADLAGDGAGDRGA